MNDSISSVGLSLNVFSYRSSIVDPKRSLSGLSSIARKAQSFTIPNLGVPDPISRRSDFTSIPTEPTPSNPPYFHLINKQNTTAVIGAPLTDPGSTAEADSPETAADVTAQIDVAASRLADSKDPIRTADAALAYKNRTGLTGSQFGYAFGMATAIARNETTHVNRARLSLLGLRLVDDFVIPELSKWVSDLLLDPNWDDKDYLGGAQALYNSTRGQWGTNVEYFLMHLQSIQVLDQVEGTQRLQRLGTTLVGLLLREDRKEADRFEQFVQDRYGIDPSHPPPFDAGFQWIIYKEMRGILAAAPDLQSADDLLTQDILRLGYDSQTMGKATRLRAGVSAFTANLPNTLLSQEGWMVAGAVALGLWRAEVWKKGVGALTSELLAAGFSVYAFSRGQLDERAGEDLEDLESIHKFNQAGEHYGAALSVGGAHLILKFLREVHHLTRTGKNASVPVKTQPQRPKKEPTKPEKKPASTPKKASAEVQAQMDDLAARISEKSKTLRDYRAKQMELDVRRTADTPQVYERTVKSLANDIEKLTAELNQIAQSNGVLPPDFVTYGSGDRLGLNGMVEALSDLIMALFREISEKGPNPERLKKLNSLTDRRDKITSEMAERGFIPKPKKKKTF